MRNIPFFSFKLVGSITYIAVLAHTTSPRESLDEVNFTFDSEIYNSCESFIPYINKPLLQVGVGGNFFAQLSETVMCCHSHAETDNFTS